jgi:hypothetical protein
MDIKQKYEAALSRIESVHIKSFPGQAGPVFLISTAYPGVWMEHVYDALVYANLNPAGGEVARNQTLLFLRNQKPSGRMPFNVIDSSVAAGRYGSSVGYSQIQECVSFGALCLEAYRILNDKEYLKEAYKGLKAWDSWLEKNRMSLGKGLIELFCLYDTGHDNAARLSDIPNKCPDVDGVLPVDSDAVPMLAPDMNAVFYGDRMALAEMAEELGRVPEAREWREKATGVKKRMFEHLYDPDDLFFYDVDRQGRKRKFLSIAISNVFQERVLDKKEADAVYARHMKNPKEFWTPYPFPSMAVSDPGSKKDRDGNSWGYYSQALTALRGARWMDFYGYGADYDELLSRWVEAITRGEMNFSQELDPMTGEMSKSSEWYSSALLLYVYACRRLGYVK